MTSNERKRSRQLQGAAQSDGVRAVEARALLDARHLSLDQGLPDLGEDPAREDPARADHRSGEGLGSAWTRRGGISDRHEVELHAAQLTDPEVRRVQLG